MKSPRLTKRNRDRQLALPKRSQSRWETLPVPWMLAQVMDEEDPQKQGN
ncbi:MAG: hypothetical protein N4J56_001588 [Chroococcidiopsis sp. SAG 2025]|jgi:hypothetical protein|nr:MULTISPECIES: hypothetical protein [unclassified Chroococcidiopsis]MDV2991934.1 hypothetical protein [Chroococcidiopsis sp. SAG 2025]URD50117.1 hypothetical protein M5J74_27930 [Chroococcidiopsis sp. CCNUC1]